MKRAVVELSEEQTGEIYESLAAFDRKHIGCRFEGSVNIGIVNDVFVLQRLNGAKPYNTLCTA